MEYQDAIDAAVDAAVKTYNEEEKSPIDHGFAHIEGVDGRTSLATALEQHDKVNADSWDYITVSGVSRYLTPQRKAYRAFIETLEEHDVDTEGIYVRGRLD